MGNHKFRLSNIIPNGWLYKLKEMGITPKSTPIPTLPTTATAIDEDAVQAAITRRNSPPLPRKSYHFSRKRCPATKKTTNSPTPSSTTTKSSSSSSVSAACSCRSTATVQSALRSKPSSSPLQETASSLHSFDQMVAWSSTSCHCSSNSPVPYGDDDDDDVVIGVDKISHRCKTDDENADSRAELPPIRTEHRKFSDLVSEIGEAEEQLLLVDKAIKHRKSSVKYRQDHVISRSPVRRIPTGYGSPRVRVRFNSPQLSRRVLQVENGAGRKSVSRSGRRKKRVTAESMAVVKASSDPERDFRESMMEMIVENEIREAEELEELLACYLSLNSMEYHHLIVHVFQQIWFDLNHITL